MPALRTEALTLLHQEVPNIAILKVLPHQDIISSFKGAIDFYLYKGQACARKWPTWKRRTPTPEEKANQELFSYINQAAPSLPPFIKEQLKKQAAGTPFTWKDLLVRAYMKGIEY